MRTAETLYHLAVADLRERTRRYSFLITLLGTLFFGYLVITGKWTLRLGEYRGEYNSAWVGSVMATASTCILGIFGFYLVKNALSRDRHTRVGEILAATPLRGDSYVAAKFISNLGVLSLLTAILAIAAVIMQLLSPARAGFDLWALVAPFLFVCLPVMPLVAAAAVLFESIRPLRGTVGNIIYFMIAEAAIVSSFLVDIPLVDFTGLGMFMPSMEQAALAVFPDATLGFEMGFVAVVPGTGHETMNLFPWGGIEWSLGMVPVRLVWIGAALVMVALAARFFDRFDPACARRVQASERRRRPQTAAGLHRGNDRPLIRWADVGPVASAFSFTTMVWAELKLMVKGYHWSWYLVAAALIAGQLAVPYEYARTFVMCATWVWPLAMWSSMGSREMRFNTRQILFSSAFPQERQFPALWFAGLTVAVVTGSGMITRAVIVGDIRHLTALLAGAFFVPTLALFLGVTSGSKKLFEVSYLLVWYIGPVNHLAAFDFLGATSSSIAVTAPHTFFGVTLLLLMSAWVFRYRQLTCGIG